jgi:hypothetical protein
MLSLPRNLFMLTIAVAALSSAVHAQVLTADTRGSSGDGSYTGIGGGYATTQTFTDITEIDLLTFRLLAQSDHVFAASTVDYYLSAWDSGTGKATGAALATGTLNIADISSWQAITYGANSFNYLDVGLDLSSVATGLTPAETYAISFYGSTAGTLYGAGSINNPAAYADGGAFTSYGPFNSGTDLQTIGQTDASATYDTLFAAGSLSAVPETGTTAVLFAGVFVMGLVGWRLRQRRQANRESAAIV